MKFNSKLACWSLPALGIAAALALVAWTDGPLQSNGHQQTLQDTIPSKKYKSGRQPGDKDLDKEIRDLENAKERLKEVDWDQIKKSLENVHIQLDEMKIDEQIEKAMKEVDMEKINLQVEEALKKVDFDKIQQEINESLKHSYAGIDKEALKKQLDAAKVEIEKEMNSPDWKKKMEELRKVDMKKLQEDLEGSREEVRKAMENLDKQKFDFDMDMNHAGKGIDKAKEEFKGYQEMIYSLEKEGLLSTKSDYTIKYKNGALTINGKQQPQEMADRYKKYFKHDEVTIRKEDGEMDIDTDFD